jgi:hypothetical protein
LLSQGIRGEIQDQNGDPVPYAAIYIKQLTRGTTCNALGKFSLPLPPGHYTIYFRSLGYTEVSREITVGDEYIELLIKLPPQTYMIPEVRISASGEDPAYWIMRKAIGLASYHLHEVSSYSAEIYIKGTAYFDRIPRAIAQRIEVGDIRVRENQVYMLESLNQVKYTAPDKYEMKVIASQNTLPGYTQNVNPMDYINASLYQEQIQTIVSPLARNAFFYYNYRFEGSYMEGTHVINKIRVIPKRRSQQLCAGTLYIVENLWCLHSSDLEVNTIAGTLYLQQLYANVIMDAWLPVNHKIQADVEIAGVRGKITYVSSLKYSDVTLNPNLPEAYFTPLDETAGETGEEKELSGEEKRIRELLEKEELTNRDVSRLSKLMEKEAEEEGAQEEGENLNQTGTTFTVAEDAVKNDSVFWNRVRPIPLTPREQTRLRERDSIIGITRQVADADSLRMARRRGKPFRNLMLGKTYRAGPGRFRLTHGGLIDLDMLGYNTVDGIYYAQDFRLHWKPDSIHTFRSHLQAGYAFHRHAPMISWGSDLLYAPMRRGKVALYLNYTSSDFNGSTGIPPVTNMAYSLLLRENYLKKYEQIDATLYNRIDLVNGLVLTTELTCGLQRPLTNHSDFSFFFTNKKEFTGNRPPGLMPDDPALESRNKLAAGVSLEFTPRYYFVVRNFRKEMQDSDWPTFSLEYRRGIPAGSGAWSDFGVISFGVDHEAGIGLLSELNWQIQAGYFLDAGSLHFSDFRHFKSNPLPVDMAGLDRALMLMDYYEASTNEYWTRACVNLTSSYLLLKFLPWLSERLWKESVGITYLYTPAISHYLQVGYSLEEIFFLADVGVYAAFQDFAWNGFGVRLNFRF